MLRGALTADILTLFRDYGYKMNHLIQLDSLLSYNDILAATNKYNLTYTCTELIHSNPPYANSIHPVSVVPHSCDCDDPAVVMISYMQQMDMFNITTMNKSMATGVNG